MTEHERLVRDIDTLRESIRLTYAELATTFTTSERRNLIKHVQILQGELGTLIERAERLDTAAPLPPFQMGDRVQHQIFGAGTVTAPLVATVKADPNASDGVRHAGWRVSVEWDDPNRLQSDVMDASLSVAD